MSGIVRIRIRPPKVKARQRDELGYPIVGRIADWSDVEVSAVDLATGNEISLPGVQAISLKASASSDPPSVCLRLVDAEIDAEVLGMLHDEEMVVCLEALIEDIEQHDAGVATRRRRGELVEMAKQVLEKRGRGP
jgi:hypothetical protein